MKLPVCLAHERQTGNFATGAVLGELKHWQWPCLNSLRLRVCSPRRIAQLFVGSQLWLGGSLKLSQQLPILQIGSIAWPPAVWVDGKPADNRFSAACRRAGWELERPRKSVREWQ